MRESGILLAISSLPSEYGIGCFSREAYEFADRLSEYREERRFGDRTGCHRRLIRLTVNGKAAR